MTSVFDNQSIAFTDISGNTASLIPGTGLVIASPTETLTTNTLGFFNGTNSLLFTDLYATVEKTRAIKFATSTLTKLSVQDTIEMTDGITTNTLTKSDWTGTIKTVNTSANLTHYLNFSDSSSTGQGNPQKTAGLSVNPSTNTITATTFSGSLSGNSSSASSISLTSDNTSGTYYLPFSKTVASNSTLYVDNSTTPLTYDPSTSTLTSSQLTLNTPSVIDTNLGKYGIFINSSGTKTYPASPFTVFPSYYSSVQVGNNQTINSGINSVIGMYNQLIKNDGTTAVNTSLTLRGFDNDISWLDNNCPTILTGVNNTVNYAGGTGTLRMTGQTNNLLISPITSNAITLNTLNGINNSITLGTINVANQTYNLGVNGVGISSSLSTFNSSVGNTNRIINITEYKSFRSFNSFGGVAGGTPATGCITTIGTYTMFSGELFFQQNGAGSTSTITNLYGLRLPDITNTGTITNNWGISQEATTAKNYFAGNVGIGIATNNSSAKLQVDSTTQGFLPPRMTGAQANAIATPAEGLMVYITDAITAPFLIKGWWGYNGATWTQIG